jgi:hypothetical protein
LGQSFAAMIYAAAVINSRWISTDPRARSEKMDHIPASAPGTSFSEKSSLNQTDADQDRFSRKK